MFVGHYSVAFAAKSHKNKIPLWVLFVAVQFLDYIWATLVLLGIEKLRVIKGFTAGSMLDSYFHPYSHSLITAMAWSGVAALLYKTIWRAKASSSAAVIVGLAVFSHWILDLIAHPRDLAIYDDTWKVGFGLWNYRDPVCIGNRASRGWDHCLPRAECDAANSQYGDNRLWNRSGYRSDRGHVCASRSINR